jgi:hypothetical protein
MLSLNSPTQLTRLRSTKQQVEYVGLRKGKGRILVLDLSEYKSMFIDINQLLGINFEYDPG